MPYALDPDVLRARVLTPDQPWAEVEYHRTIGSTNARAAEIGRPWVVVAADHQSSGRGRLTRRWEAPPGTSVAVSATVPAPATGSAWIPLLAGLAVAEAIEQTTGLAADLKWPNDVLLRADAGRKVCGILCEVVGKPGGTTGAGQAAPSIVVVGSGINVAQSREQLPVDTATSLALAGGEVDETTGTGLVAAYLRLLASRYADLDEQGGRATVSAHEYRRRCTTIGRQVRLTRAHSDDVLGRVVDVDDQGRLVIDGPAGLAAWSAGDVVHVRRGLPTGDPD